MTVNKVMLIGNVGRDPEVKHLDKGLVVVTIPIATTERFKDKNGELKEQTDWHNVVFWRGLAEFVEKYVRKGSQIYVEGKLRTRTWEDQSGQRRYSTEIVAELVRLLGKRSDSGSATPPQQEEKNVTPPVNEIDDDLPF